MDLMPVAEGAGDAVAEARTRWFGGSAGDWPRVRGKVTYPSRAQVMELAVHLSRPVPGRLIEFGVWKGHSVRAMRDALWRYALWEPRAWSKRI
jgi:hypothetical protein